MHTAFTYWKPKILKYQKFRKGLQSTAFKKQQYSNRGFKNQDYLSKEIYLGPRYKSCQNGWEGQQCGGEIKKKTQKIFTKEIEILKKNKIKLQKRFYQKIQWERLLIHKTKQKKGIQKFEDKMHSGRQTDRQIDRCIKLA